MISNWLRPLLSEGDGTYLTPLGRAAVELRNEIRTARISRRSRKVFEALAGRRGLKLHLGSGSDVRPGWVNVDLLTRADSQVPLVGNQPGDVAFVNYDVRRRIPLEDGCCKLVYSSHMFEHLEHADAVRLMRDCHRLLEPGGVFRVSIPDFRSCFRAYLERDIEFFTLIDETELVPGGRSEDLTLVDFINYTVYQHGQHRSIFDEEKLVHLLTGIGFSHVARSEFQPAIDPGSPQRQRYSLYMEAVK